MDPRTSWNGWMPLEVGYVTWGRKLRVGVGIRPHVLNDILIIYCRSSSRCSSVTAAGVMPGMREAWPRVSGRWRWSFSFTSLLSPGRCSTRKSTGMRTWSQARWPSSRRASRAWKPS